MAEPPLEDVIAGVWAVYQGNELVLQRAIDVFQIIAVNGGGYISAKDAQVTVDQLRAALTDVQRVRADAELFLGGRRSNDAPA